MPNVVVSLVATLALSCAHAPDSQPRQTTSPAPRSAASERAFDYLRAHTQALGVQPSDLDDLIVTSETTSKSIGVTHVYVRQRYRGIDISGSEMTVNVGRDGNVLNHAGEFFADLDRVTNHPSSSMSAADAVAAAAKHLGMALTPSERSAAPATRVYHPVSRRELRLAWMVELKTRDEQHWWVVTIDAVSGALLHKTDRVVSVKEEVA